MDVKNVVLQKIDEVCSNSTSQFVALPPVPQGRVLIAKRVYAQTSSTAATSFSLAIRRTGTVFTLDYYAPVSGVQSYSWSDDIIVPEGCELGIVFAGATLNEVLTLVVDGFYTQ